MFCVDRLVRCTIWTYMCAYERGPVAKTVYSDNQNNVDALAERLSSQTSLSAERAKLVAYDLLCRKALKIKSSALAQIFRSVDKECDTKAMRDELIAANIVTKIEGSGINGRPAFYTINVEIRDAQEQPAESVEDFVVEDSADVPAVEEVAPREHVDTDELLDENVVRAFTAKAGRGGFGGVASAMRSVAPSRSASVAPLLERVRRMPRLLRTRLLPIRRGPRRSKSPWRPRSPSVAVVPTLRLRSRMSRMRLKSLPRLQTMLRSLPRRLRVHAVPGVVLRGARIP